MHLAVWPWSRYSDCPCGGGVHREDIGGLPMQTYSCGGMVLLLCKKMEKQKKNEKELRKKAPITKSLLSQIICWSHS